MLRRLLALLALAACDPGGSRLPDATAAADATADPLADAGPVVDADPAACDPQQTWNAIAQRPIEPGDYCDDIQLCADPADVAAITAAAPGFDCRDDGPCPAPQRSCAWHDVDTVDAADWAQLCAITVMPDPPRPTCWIYL